MDVLRKDNSPFVIFKDEISCIMSSDPVHSGHCIVLPSTPIDNWYTISFFKIRDDFNKIK